MLEMQHIEILEKIFSIESRRPGEKDFSLFGGLLGKACLFLEYSEITQKSEPREIGNSMLSRALNKYPVLSRGLSHGKWGFIPAFANLIEKNIVDQNPRLESILDKIRREEFFIYGDVPVKKYREDPFLTDAVLLLDIYRVTGDPLNKIKLEERLIKYISECEYLLTEYFPLIHHPDELTWCQLHSMAWFLNEMTKENLYPHKTQRVFLMLVAFAKNKLSDGSLHSLLFEKEVYGKTAGIPDEIRSDFKAYIKFLNESGYYAWLYRDRSMFLDFIDSRAIEILNKESDIPKEVDICGIGLGLVSPPRKSCSGLRNLTESTDLNLTIKLADALKPSVMSNTGFNDLTFCIPVRIDSEDRMRNLETVIKYYSKRPHVRFIILEADIHPKGGFCSEYKNVEYIYINDPNPVFHRTRYINLLLKKCHTKYAAVWDTDAIAAQSQIANALDMIKEGDHILVYPYGGIFLTVTDYFSDCFAYSLELDILQKFPQHNYLMCGYHSVGGAFIVNAKRYLALGGENENFIGWGPEDVERWERLEILGHRPVRAGGVLYHLNHPRGYNSGDKDNDVIAATRQELLKICRMSPDELSRYVRSWDWIEETV